jgi:membrane protein involved in colicin uptake
MSRNLTSFSMDRRSTRLKNRPQKKTSNQDESDSEQEQDSTKNTATKGRGSKRKATQVTGSKATNQHTTKKLKRSGGLLQAFVEMPVDVFFEVRI